METKTPTIEQIINTNMSVNSFAEHYLSITGDKISENRQQMLQARMMGDNFKQDRYESDPKLPTYKQWEFLNLLISVEQDPALAEYLKYLEE